jgi:hypothetical protein
MTPWEIQCHVDYLAQHAISGPALAPTLERLNKFIAAWHGAWSQFGTAETGFPAYRQLIEQVRSDLQALDAISITLSNEELFAYSLEALVFRNAIARDRAPAVRTPIEDASLRPQAASSETVATDFRHRIERPIFIVSSPRSGSTLLFHTLAQAPGLYSVGGESHGLIEKIPAFSVPFKGWVSNRLTAEDARPGPSELLAENFYRALRDRDGKPPAQTARMLEKTPKNALRVPFFDAIWPDAQFVFLYRDPRQTLSSMIEAWISGGFRTYSGLPAWTGRPWSLLLIPGWPQLIGAPLPNVVAHQWATTMDVLVSDLSLLPKDKVRAIVYDELIDSPQPAIETLAKSLSIEWDRQLGSALPLSRTTVSKPARDKWRRNSDVIEAILPIVKQADLKARAFIDSLRG